MVEKACFGAGCFWGTDHVFRQFPGILKVVAGYIGGEIKNPSYKDVCSGKTGHAEVVYIEFDEKKISYEKLLEIFFKCHDPTQVNGQGPDIGNQYRSAIFYYGESQKKQAQEFKQKYEKTIKKKITTTIDMAEEFYAAEEYHQKYYERNDSAPYCHVVPKIKI